MALTKKYKFSNDLQIYLQVFKIFFLNGIKLIEEDINLVLEWSHHNLLIWNLKKIQATLLGTGQQIEEVEHVSKSLYSSNQVIPFLKSVKNLGIIIDSNLYWDLQISKMIRAKNFTLYKLRSFKHLMDKVKLVTTLVFPRLDYCNFALGILNKVQDQKIHKIINSVVRYVTGAPLRSQDTPLRIALGWLNPKNRLCTFPNAQYFNYSKRVKLHIWQFFNLNRQDHSVLRFGQNWKKNVLF